MKKTLILAVAAFVCLIGFQAEAQVSHSSSPALATTSSTCTGADGTGNLVDVIAFAEAGTISDVNVTVEIDHTWRADLQFHVSYDSGVAGNVVLAADHGSTSANDYYATFDDDSLNGDCATLCTSDAACVAATPGECTPDMPLSGFDALTSPGTWTMMVCDDAGGDDGTWQSWTVTVDGDGGLPVELMSFIIE